MVNFLEAGSVCNGKRFEGIVELAEKEGLGTRRRRPTIGHTLTHKWGERERESTLQASKP